MFHLLRRRPGAHGDPSATTTVALQDDLQLLFSTLANPIGRPPAREWSQAVSDPSAAVVGTRVRPRRIAGGVIAGLTAVVLSAAGYAAVTGASLTDRLWANFGSEAAEESRYPIGLSQTVDGLTVTVDHIIFDGVPLQELNGAPLRPEAQYVPLFVQFTVSGLPVGDELSYSVDQSLKSGELPLSPVGAVGLRGQSGILKRELPPGAVQMLIAFDTTGAALDSGPLRLQLTVTLTPRAPAGSAQDGQTPTAGRIQSPSESTSGTPSRFLFDFEVPIR